MSFKDDYINEIEKVRVSEAVKQRVSASLQPKKAEKKRLSMAAVYRAAAAVAACFALVVSIWAVNTDNLLFDFGRVSEKNISKSSVTYNDIYKTVKEFVPEERSFLDGIFNSFAKNSEADGAAMEIIEEYAAEEDFGTVAGTGASVSQSNSAVADSSDSYSETTAQVEGVSESDIVKTDGKYIYSLSVADSRLRIIKAGKEPQLLSKTYIKQHDFDITEHMYLLNGKIVVIGNSYEDNSTSSVVIAYDVSNPQEPKELFRCEQSGYVNDSRLIGDKLYLITNYSLNVGGIKEDEPSTYVPAVTCGDYDGEVVAESVYINSNVQSAQYTVICGYSLADGSLCGTQSVLGGTYALYCSTDNIITAGYSKDDTTSVTRFALNDGNIELKATGEVKGTLLNQFSIDEYNGYFRFVTTVNEGVETREEKYVSYKISNSNSLYVLDGELKQVGAIEDLATDERVYSVRFMGDIAYFVTFRQVDPLFSADLSDPENPKIIGKLKIPGFSTYMFPYGEGKLLGIGQEADENTGRTGGVKLSMFDISDPANVTENAKTVLDADYSEALYSHKAIIADYKRNIIGFSVWGERGSEYRMFTFKDGGFVKVAEIELGQISSVVRGLYINDQFYVVTDSTLLVYDMTNGYTKIAELGLN